MNTDKPLGVALIALGASGIAVASQISVRTFNNDPGPKLFPIMACTILVICGLGLLLQRGASPARAIPAEEWRRGGLMAALLVGYAFGLWLVGFHIATLAGSFASYWVIAGPDRRRLVNGAVYAMGLTLAVHLVFAVALNAFLPRGIWF
ncbi:MAG: tripartite tricarboxylate transporter TctB family protein [Paracoccus sp.]|nr:tripartite tricarboxylate transporter TctB family protein [Paracoccus sp. (in: a-proteobacteria)]